MNSQKKKSINLPLIIGILGTIAGVFLIFSDNSFIGFFGAIASAGLAYKGYKDSKELKK
jgi:hypothetical protein